MNPDSIISNIINLPVKYHQLGNVSFYSLLKETGYFEIYNQVDEVNILKELVSHPEYIDSWMMWSDDKRTSSGWYINQNKKGKYNVGYFPKKENIKLMEYIDIKEACAAFIKREIEEIRNISLKAK